MPTYFIFQLFDETKAFFTLHLQGCPFLVRQICRSYGTPTYNALIQQEDLKAWIAPQDIKEWVSFLIPDLRWLSALSENSPTLNFRHVTHVFI